MEIDNFGTTLNNGMVKTWSFYKGKRNISNFGNEGVKFWDDKERTYTDCQKVEFTIQSSYFQKFIFFKLSKAKNYDRKYNMEFKKNRTVNGKFRIIYLRNKSKILVQTEDDILFEELKPDMNMAYYQNKIRLNAESKLIKGDNWLDCRSILIGGGPKYQDVQIEFFVIYTSMDKLIKFEKVDLIGFDEDMDEWLMTAIDYRTDYKVTICEAGTVEGQSFWIDAYKLLKNDCELQEWMYFFKKHNPSLTKMDHKRCDYMFRSTMKENYYMSKCLFIDQVYHSGHNRLHEALYANFSAMHKMIWVVNCFEYLMKDQTMKSLAKTSSENKKSSQYN
jgi:hypothetical protein